MSATASTPPGAQVPKQSLPDYTSWDHSSLLARVSDLEAQLRAQSQVVCTGDTTKLSPSPHPTSSIISGPDSAESPCPAHGSQTASTFQVSKYSTRLVAIKFAYIGSAYNGFEYTPGNVTRLPTVEETLWRALRRGRLVASRGGSETTPDEAVDFEGMEYSKCGRTDKGVSAFGQVIGIRIRSARPNLIISDKEVHPSSTPLSSSSTDDTTLTNCGFHEIDDELPYVHILNRLLPPTIRILAWCPHLPTDFSARFSCRERQYRYYFTNPAFPPQPHRTSSGPSLPLDTNSGWLHLDAMQRAASLYIGLHDFRNFCKVDASKQIENFQRRIFHASIDEVAEPVNFVSDARFRVGHTASMCAGPLPTSSEVCPAGPKTYCFRLHGSAFLWHQVRHMVAILFMVGQGLEEPEIVTTLLDVGKTPKRPLYEMADEGPLVLWDCIFPDLSHERLAAGDAGVKDRALKGGCRPGQLPPMRQDAEGGRELIWADSLGWIYGDDRHGEGKWSSTGVVNSIWKNWRKSKIEEVLWGELMDIAVHGRSGNASDGRGASSLADITSRTDLSTVESEAKRASSKMEEQKKVRKSQKIFAGGDNARSQGVWRGVMGMNKGEEVDVLNRRYRERMARQRGSAEHPVGIVKRVATSPSP